MDSLFFILKYIPFWATPLALISVQFFYLFWLKEYKVIAIFWAVTLAFSLVSIGAYFLMGGPDLLIHTVGDILRSK